MALFKSHKKPEPNETEIIGSWELIENKVKKDENCDRIEHLISQYFIKKAVTKDGWESLYQDPLDLRFWEHTYPNSAWHGGGPPALINISEEKAKKKYNFKDNNGDPWLIT